MVLAHIAIEIHREFTMQACLKIRKILPSPHAWEGQAEVDGKRDLMIHNDPFI